MRATFLFSPSETSRVRPSLRFTFGDFEVRMCRVFVWPRLILPVPVLLKRLAAPVWVFNLGIFLLVWDGSSHPAAPPVRQGFPCPLWASSSIAHMEPVRRSGIIDLAEAYGALRSLIPITTNRPPNHDQLQAIMGGLAGLPWKSAPPTALASSAIHRAAKKATGAKASSCCPWLPSSRPGCAGCINHLQWGNFPSGRLFVWIAFRDMGFPPLNQKQ